MAEPTKIDFFSGDYMRRVANTAMLMLRNRYYEMNPQFSTDGASLVARPGLRYVTTVGEGPIRGMYAEEDAFLGNLFVASYDTLYRLTAELVPESLFVGLFNPEQGIVNMTSTQPIGEVPEFLFFADGRNLYVFIENGYAMGTITGVPANGNVVRTDATYYQFTNASVDAGAPAGTVANPWLVSLGGTTAAAWANFAAAVNASGIEGVDYSTGTAANPSVQAVGTDALLVAVQARAVGVLGNGVVTTETGGAIAWSNGGNLINGGDNQVRGVQMPEDVGAFDVATINSFVIVLPTQEGIYTGRFYWIEPGETTVDPLNFATAERSPDGILSVEVVGDLFWFPGGGSTEAWYVSQDENQRMQRLQGVVFDRGTWKGTAVAMHDKLMLTGSDGAVFQISGGAPRRVSTPGIEELIRTAIQYQRHVSF